jgi:hypothetical protein
MKKIILITSLLLLAVASFAQTSEPSKYQKKQATKYTKELTDYISNITDDQKTAIYNINLNISLQFDSLKKLQLETVDYKKAARNIFVFKDDQLKKILSVNQFDEYVMMKDEKKEEYLKKKAAQQKIVADSTLKK